MGTDMTVHILKYDRDNNLFYEVELFRRRKKHEMRKIDENGDAYTTTDPYTRVPVYCGRDSEMFDGMKNGDEIDGYGCFPLTQISMNSLEPEFRKKIEKLQETAGYFDFHEISLSEMKAYILQHPEVVDYDDIEGMFGEGFDKAPHKINPIKYLYEDIRTYINLADDFYGFEPDSSFKIIIYFDC